jgi:hypothetical protein
MYVFDVKSVTPTMELFYTGPIFDTIMEFKGNTFVLTRLAGRFSYSVIYDLGDIWPFEEGEVSNMVSIIENRTTEYRIK